MFCCFFKCDFLHPRPLVSDLLFYISVSFEPPLLPVLFSKFLDSFVLDFEDKLKIAFPLVLFLLLVILSNRYQYSTLTLCDVGFVYSLL